MKTSINVPEKPNKLFIPYKTIHLMCSAMKRILVTGTSGLLGSKIVGLAEHSFEVIPTHNTQPFFKNSIKMDITDAARVLRVVTRTKPDVVMHVAAETSVDDCEKNKEAAWKANVEGTKNVAVACCEIDARLIYVSTDYVFDGGKGFYVEGDEPKPVNYYGWTKLKGEEFVRENCQHYVIARPSVIYGRHALKTNFASWVIESLRRGERITVVDDHYNSPTLADNLAEALLEIAEKDLCGVFHTAGSERINRYEFALKIAQDFGLDANLIRPVKMSELRIWMAKRPPDSSLCINKAQKQLETEFLNVHESLKRIKTHRSLTHAKIPSVLRIKIPNISQQRGFRLKGIILHGGYGTRLRPLTHTGPKQLIPVANKPISQHVLEDLREAGIRDVGIVLGDVYPEKVVEYYGDGSKFGVKITYIRQIEPKGIAHAVGLCREFVGNERFVVYLGDNLLKGGIKKFVDEFGNSNHDGMILLCDVKNPERFGVAEFNSKRKLIRLIEKPKQPPSNYALTGIYFFKPVVFEMIEQLRPSWRAELEITEALQLMLDSGHDIGYRFVAGWWKDTGTTEDILESNRLILDELEREVKGTVEDDASVQGRVSVGELTVVKRGALIRGPVIIGNEALIENQVYIGPYTSIGNNVKIKKGEIENSIIMDNCHIDINEKITDSLIGPDSTIVTNHTGPRGHRLIVGEGSRITM